MEKNSPAPGDGSGGEESSPPPWSNYDRLRLSRLQAEGDKRQQRYLQKLRPWQRVWIALCVVGLLLTFCSPSTRGVITLFGCLGMVFNFSAFILLLFMVRWRNQIDKRANEEFLKDHGEEYFRLSKKKEAYEAWSAKEEEQKNYKDGLR